MRNLGPSYCAQLEGKQDNEFRGSQLKHIEYSFHMCEDGIPANKRLNGYFFDRAIGKGSFATVWLGLHERTRCPVAIKVISKRVHKNQELLWREINIMKFLDHPYIVTLYDVFENDDFIYIVMENITKGTVLEIVNENGILSEPQANKMFVQLIEVLDYLHNRKLIAHRDLKCENIMMDKNNDIRVIDFGLSHGCDNMMTTLCGSVAYCAPEIIRKEKYDVEADIWSAGIILYSVVTGTLPFLDQNVHNMFMKIVYEDPPMMDYFSSGIKDLFIRIFNKDPAQRITIEEIKRHPWFLRGNYKPATAAKEFTVDIAVAKEMENFGFNMADFNINVFNETRAAYQMLKVKRRVGHKILSSMSKDFNANMLLLPRSKISLPVLTKPNRNSINANFTPVVIKNPPLPRRTIREAANPLRSSLRYSQVSLV